MSIRCVAVISQKTVLHSREKVYITLLCINGIFWMLLNAVQCTLLVVEETMTSASWSMALTSAILHFGFNRPKTGVHKTDRGTSTSWYAVLSGGAACWKLCQASDF